MKKLILLFCLLLDGCFGGGCGFSDKCYHEREREGIVMLLTPEERERERERCIIAVANRYDNSVALRVTSKKRQRMKEKGIKEVCIEKYKEPTPEELEKLRHDKG